MGQGYGREAECLWFTAALGKGLCYIVWASLRMLSIRSTEPPQPPPLPLHLILHPPLLPLPTLLLKHMLLLPILPLFNNISHTGHGSFLPWSQPMFPVPQLPDANNMTIPLPATQSTVMRHSIDSDETRLPYPCTHVDSDETVALSPTQSQCNFSPELFDSPTDDATIDLPPRCSPHHPADSLCHRVVT